MQEEEEAAPVWSEDEPLRTEPRGFTHEQMVTCENCLRANPPTRASCLYCGATLTLTSETAALLKPMLRPMESWEQGFNAIFLPCDARPDADSLADISDLVQLEAEDLERMMELKLPLPLARAATPQEATAIEARLAARGLTAMVVSDAELDAHAPQRVRTMEVSDGALVLYLTGSQSEQRVAWPDITLFVAGRRIQRRLEVSERLARKKEKEIVESRELSADEPRLDIYLNRASGGWRVAADNFDFSCLGERKSLIAAQNLQTLTNLLREHALNAVYDETYLRARPLLSLVWPLEQHTESLGLKRRAMGGRVNTGAITTSDNEMQFTRYSRLLHYLRLRATGRLG